MLRIIGAQGNVQNIDSFLEIILSFAQKYDITIQAFDADMIYGKNHLISSVEHAIRAIKRKTIICIRRAPVKTRHPKNGHKGRWQECCFRICRRYWGDKR